MNKPQLVSFFVYRRQSRERFRIITCSYPSLEQTSTKQ